MNSPSPPGFRFYEIQTLLGVYAEAGSTFTDTPSERSPALNAYLRVSARDPQRAARAVQEIDDLLAVGLFSPEISDDVDLMPRVRPTGGRSVEESLRIVRNHIDECLRTPELFPTGNPQLVWEWHERFPGLRHLLGAYFHQNFSYEYTTYREAMDDYLQGEPREDLIPVLNEVPELLAMAESDEALNQVARALGLGVQPPDGVLLRQWLTDMAHIVQQHLQQSPPTGETP